MKRIVSGVIAALALSTASLSAADYYATVNGEKITKDDIAVILRNPQIDFDLLPKDRKDKAIEQAIEKKLLTGKALTSGVEKDKAYKAALDKIKKDLALEIWMQKEFKKIKVSEKEMKKYYDENKARFKQPALLEARHILLKTEKDAKDVIAQLDKAKDKKDEFVKLAKTKSTGPTASKGGYLGEFDENRMVPEFSAGAKALKVGEYSKKPVKTQFGYHVIYLEGKKVAKALPFKDVSLKIKEFLLQNKFRTTISNISKELRQKAKIVIK